MRRQAPGGVERRTIVAGAAWTIPAVAIVSAAPFAAASLAPTVEFVSVPSAVAPGATFGDIVIKATTDGTTLAPAGSVITVVLPAGLTFADGTTTKAFTVVDGSGTVTVSGVKADSAATAGSYPIVASYSTATATANLLVESVGNLYAWGYNAEGQTGNNTSSTQLAPVLWNGTEKYTSVTGAWSSFAGATSDNTVFTTGNGGSGPLANGSTGGNTIASGPVGPAVSGQTGTDGVFTVAGTAVPGQGAFSQTVWVYGTDGKLYAAGENDGGKFSLSDGSGAGSGDNAYTGFTEVGTNILAANPGATITQVDDSGWYRAVYLLSDGTVWNSGANNYRAMGNNGVAGTQYLAAQTVKADLTPLTGIVDVATSQDSAMYLDGSGMLWGAGTNDRGQLPGVADGGVAPTAVPLTQPDGKAVKNIWASKSDADSYFAETTDGQLYGVGSNLNGQLGTGSTAGTPNVWTPVIMPAGKSIKDIAPGNDGTLFLMTDGTVYFAGANDTGGAGTGSTSGAITTMQQVPLAGPALSIAATWYDSYAAVVAA